MIKSDLIKKLIVAKAESDGASFWQAVKDIIKEEKRQKNHIFAKELEGIMMNNLGLSNMDKASNFITLNMQQGMTDLPKDKDKNALLLELRETKKNLDFLTLSADTNKRLTRIIRENKEANSLRAYGLSPLKKILFYGPPGTGKTIAAEAIAKELYLPFVLVRFDSVISSYLGETAANIRRIFEYANNKPMVLFFDEFDAVGKSRSNDDEHSELKRVVNSFLQIIDSFNGQAIIIAATNHEQLLDNAIWRRFDDIISFNLPDQDQIKKVFTNNTMQFGLDKSISLPEISRKMNGMSHADVERIAITAIKTSILEGKTKLEKKLLLDSINEQRRKTDLISPKVSIPKNVTKKAGAKNARK